MSKGSTQTTRTELDPRFMAQRGQVFDAANRIAGGQFTPYGGQAVAGLDPRTLAAYQSLGQVDPRIASAYGGLIPNLGFASETLRGATGPLDISQYMDPYQQQVIGATQEDFARQRELAMRGVGDEFTGAGAFGGARHGVAEGVALGELGRAETQTLAGLRSAGFQNATQAALQQRGLGLTAAGQMANLGFGGAAGLYGAQREAAGSMAQLGEMQRLLNQAGLDFNYQQYMREQEDPFRRFGLLSSTMSAPYGSTQTTQTSQSPWGSILGAGAMIGGTLLGGPAGGAAASSLMTPRMESIQRTNPYPQLTGPTMQYEPMPAFPFGY